MLSSAFCSGGIVNVPGDSWLKSTLRAYKQQQKIYNSSRTNNKCKKTKAIANILSYTFIHLNTLKKPKVGESQATSVRHSKLNAEAQRKCVINALMLTTTRTVVPSDRVVRIWILILRCLANTVFLQKQKVLRK